MSYKVWSGVGHSTPWKLMAATAVTALHISVTLQKWTADHSSWVMRTCCLQSIAFCLILEHPNAWDIQVVIRANNGVHHAKVPSFIVLLEEFSWGVAKGTGVFSLEQRRLRKDFIILYSHIKGGCSKVGPGLFSQVINDRPGGDNLDVRKNSLTKILTRHWNKLLREVVESLCLEMFNKHVNVACRDMVKWWIQQC